MNAEAAEPVEALTPRGAPNNGDGDGDEGGDGSSPSMIPTYTSAQELSQILSERHVLQLSEEEDEMLDPIERAVRYVIPIPKHYYWDVVKSEADLKEIPAGIKLWHKAIASANSAGEWTAVNIAQPIASGLGLTTSRFAFVTDQMNEDDMAESRRSVKERQIQDQELSERGLKSEEQRGEQLELQEGSV